MSDLQPGNKIPSFKGLTAKGPVTNKDLKGAVTVLYFYPKDDTPGCTKEACDFRDNFSRLKKSGVAVYGVSKDSLPSHEKFTKKYELPFQLISDSDGSICESFGVWVEKSMYGRKYMGIERATFLIDSNGVIQRIWRKVSVTGHIDEVLSEIKNIVKSNK